MRTIYTYNGSANSDLNSIQTFLNNISENLLKYIHDDEQFFDIKLILNELVVNGATHGNKNSIDKKVFLDMELTSRGIKIQVRDEGSGIDFDIKSYDVNERKCSGRGLVIVDALTDNLICRENEVIAVKYL